MTKATPGPWSVERDRNNHYGMVEVRGPGVGGTIVSGFVSGTDIDETRRQQVVADAKLIAAAPELLEACERTKEILDAWGPERWGDTLERLHKRLSAAITKATT